jgi:nitroimidazol reductase NimA-like FMN-containing flavoprotein (pyridoxamine 5'-phosphate oxidase superfamily)
MRSPVRGSGVRTGKENLMSDGIRAGHVPPAAAGPRPPAADAAVEQLDEQECWRLVAGQEVGRIAFNGRFGPTVFPVNYQLFEGSIVFRTGEGSALAEDLRTGIADAEYKIAFEIDELNPVTREGWSVLIQGSAHHVTSEAERAAVAGAGVTPWPGGSKEQFMRIRPTRVTGRRITHPAPPAG